jgi:hypothetical protein
VGTALHAFAHLLLRTVVSRQQVGAWLHVAIGSGAMRQRRRSLAGYTLIIVGLVLALPAEAKSLHITGVVGQPVRVFGHVRFAKDCSASPIPAMTVVTAPSMGTLSTKPESVTLTAPDFGTCPPGSRGPGVVVYYTAKATGKDSFHYRMSSPGLPTTDWQVTVDNQ